MYSKDFVVAIIVNGKVSSETKTGIVAVPEGAEYTIRLRNKNSRRAVAKVFIDDENVTQDGIVIPANDYVDLERPTTKAVKFKFVSADSEEAVDFGKNNKTDGSNGIVRVEWRLEKEVPAPVFHQYQKRPLFEREDVSPWFPYPTNPLPDWPMRKWLKPQSFGEVTCSNKMDKGVMNFDAPEEGQSRGKVDVRKLREGCTVEGGVSAQRFSTTHVDLEHGTPTIIMLTLRLADKKPVLVNKFCANCSAELVAKANFCVNCGKKITRRR